MFVRARRASPRSPARGAFTLLELLVVMAVIAILSSLVIGVIAGVWKKARIAAAKGELASLRLAVANYEHDTGRYPRRPGPAPKGGADLFRNDAGWLYAALRNRPSPALGGGPNSPYLDGHFGHVGFADAALAAPGWASRNPADCSPAAPWVELLPKEEAEQASLPAWQAAHLPVAGSRFPVFVDPWGNPYVYVEWASIPPATRDSATFSGVSQLRAGGELEQHVARSEAPFRIYSFGPNGIDELGQGDDVTPDD